MLSAKSNVLLSPSLVKITSLRNKIVVIKIIITLIQGKPCLITDLIRKRFNLTL